MSLPKTIYYCEQHEGIGGTEQCEWAWRFKTPCNPVALPVAGPDDLLMRREEGNIDRIGSDLPNWSPRQPERIQDFARARRQRPGRFAPWERDIGFLIAFYEAALAAAEGGE